MTVFHTSGFKETGPRRRVLEALRAAAGPLTAHEVAACTGTSLASTYRVLALLVELGLAGEIAEGTATGEPGEARSRRYTLCSAQGHHHHFICRGCHRMLDVASAELERALRRATAELEAVAGLRIEEHELTLRGFCAACRPAYSQPSEGEKR